MMFEDEARLRYAALLCDDHRIQHRAEWDEIRRLERLQRSIRVVRARLGLRTVPND
jgi:hypothetical protein